MHSNTFITTNFYSKSIAHHTYRLFICIFFVLILSVLAGCQSTPPLKTNSKHNPVLKSPTQKIVVEEQTKYSASEVKTIHNNREHPQKTQAQEKTSHSLENDNPASINQINRSGTIIDDDITPSHTSIESASSDKSVTPDAKNEVTQQNSAINKTDNLNADGSNTDGSNIDSSNTDSSNALPSSDQTVVMPKPDQETIQKTLLNQARRNSSSPVNGTSIENGLNIPAFNRLMDSGVNQLRQGQLNAAQSTFTRAQRLAPQSSAVYFYMSQVALKQNKYLKAEAMARRGLAVAQTTSSKKALWQVILKSAQYQSNPSVIEEAQLALSHL